MLSANEEKAIYYIERKCCMSLQKYFKDFNKTIKMDYEVKAELASKRDILLKKLRDSGKLPAFCELNQGGPMSRFSTS